MMCILIVGRRFDDMAENEWVEPNKTIRTYKVENS